MTEGTPSSEKEITKHIYILQPKRNHSKNIPPEKINKNNVEQYEYENCRII